MEDHAIVTRRRFLTTGAAGVAALAASREAAAQTPTQSPKVHVKPLVTGRGVQIGQQRNGHAAATAADVQDVVARL